MERNLNLYRIFYTVAMYGNISHAAQALFISQPAVSKAVAKLEDEMGTALLSRYSRGVTLTSEGELLYTHLTTAFDEIALAEERLRTLGTLGVGRIAIGASATLCKYLLLPYLKGFVDAHPHVRVTIESQSTYHTLKLLEERKIDVGLVVKPASAKNLAFDPIGDIHDIFVATKTYLENLHLRENGTAQLPEAFESALFRNANLMLLDDQNVSRLYVDDYFKENGIETGQILVANNMDLLIEFARIGLGVACVIREFVEEELRDGTFVEIPLRRPIRKRTAGFAYLKGAAPTASMLGFIQYCRSFKP